MGLTPENSYKLEHFQKVPNAPTTTALTYTRYQVDIYITNVYPRYLVDVK